WSPLESERLRVLAEAPGGGGWGDIARQLGGGRTEASCRARWGEMCDARAREGRAGVGSWSPEEDEKLRTLVGMFGAKWAQICMHMPGRVGKQCRERYLNHLDPSLKKTPWTPEEDALLTELHTKMNNSWADIARQMPGRCDNDVKNRWNLIQRR
ncbi:Homeodomain-like protein, partial [Tribonema minus]